MEMDGIAKAKGFEVVDASLPVDELIRIIVGSRRK